MARKKVKRVRPYRAPKLWLGLVTVIIIIFITLALFTRVNRYQTDGTINLGGLKNPVTVHRDENGMAYIYAQNLGDATVAQGFITAQNRLFQMELIKRAATGRISELAGEPGRATDRRHRTIGFLRNARKLAAILSPETRQWFEKYLTGVNAYIQTMSKEHHLEFWLSDLKPEPWSIEESLAVIYFMSWNSAANMQSEIVAQLLVDKLGYSKAAEIFPVNVNPDDQAATGNVGQKGSGPMPENLNLASSPELMAYLGSRSMELGSNNWVAGPALSPGGKPILVNDPHLDPRILPGPFYPLGIITPDNRIVGASIPGTPGFVIGRNNHVAFGTTNAYGDAQDLYVETVDPQDANRYLEGTKSIPLEIIEETMTIRDKNAPDGRRQEKLTIKLTRRGPVVSDVLSALKTDRIITLRWAPFETMTPDLGAERLMTAKSVSEIRQALSRLNWLMLNFVLADKDGHIGWVATGKLPIRSQGQSLLPYVVKDDQDNWIGWIPFDQMPQSFNPPRGWLGTCNHLTIGKDYPHYYTSYAASSYRYQRLKELMAKSGLKSVDDHWNFQRDVVNVMARDMTPVIAKVLLDQPDTRVWGQVLSQWDYRDDPDQVGPAIFQVLYRHLAIQTFEDELGPELTKTMLSNNYFWQERFHQMFKEGKSVWFDDVRTPNIKETRDDIIRRAALLAGAELKQTLGSDINGWAWGKIHFLELVSPIRRSGFGKDLLGGGRHPFPGSGETLCRGKYDFPTPYGAVWAAALRLVIDMADDDKIMAVMPSGVSDRVFDPHNTNQINPYMSGQKVFWWFSDRAIKEHRRSTLEFRPTS